MQIVVFVAIVLISTYIGIVLAKKYIRKENFYIDLLAFCNTTFTEINFTQNKLKKIIEQNINYYKKDFKLFLNLYKRYLDGEVNKENLDNAVCKNFEFLTEQEIKKIVTFFINIGKVDADNELNNLDIFKKDIKGTLDDASTKKRQFVPMIIKLSILVGIGIAILII